MMRRVVVKVGVFALLASTLLGTGATPAASAPMQESPAPMLTTSQAQELLRSRFRNIQRVTCKGDPASATDKDEFGQYWNRLLCKGTTKNRQSFTLTFVVTDFGDCDQCWTITRLRGTTLKNLRTATPAVPKPTRPQPQPGDWWWSEGTANSKLSHSLWVVNHNMDPYSVDCGGYGATWQPKNSPVLYQRFRCRMNWQLASPVWYLYRLTVIGRDKFAMTKLRQYIVP
jgi:hypothetical protein